MLAFGPLAYAGCLVELAGDLLEPRPRRGEPPLEVGDAFGDLLLPGGQDGDLAVRGAQVGAGCVQGCLQPRALGRAPGTSSLLEVDGVTTATGQHGQCRA